jgi:surface carbohydrate biosynthesis protein
VACFLTPFDLASLEIWRLAPDFVLLPYFRHYAKRSYRQMLGAGITLGVLNTEGGVIESLDKYADLLIREKSLRSQVACYCCWGPKVAHYLVERRWFDKRQVVLTGCPRTDYYAPAWRDAARGYADYVLPYARNLVLINGANPIANSGLVSDEEQVRQLAQHYRMSREEAHRWQQCDAQGLRQMTALANQLARRFPHATFVYRPHPFERLETCAQHLEPLKNLHCVRLGSVDAWILQAKAVIQRGCSTSLEARMAGVPALMPRWIPLPGPRPAAEHSSLSMDSCEELVRTLQAVLEGTFQIPEPIQRQHDEVIRDWFYQVDGLAYQRVATAILSNLPENGRERLKRACRRRAHGFGPASLVSRKWWKALAASTLESMGLPHHLSLSHWRTRSVVAARLAAWDQSAKHFDADQVRKMVRAVQGCQHAHQDGLAQAVRVELAETERHDALSGRTVVVAPAVGESPMTNHE